MKKGRLQVNICSRDIIYTFDFFTLSLVTSSSRQIFSFINFFSFSLSFLTKRTQNCPQLSQTDDFKFLNFQFPYDWILVIFAFLYGFTFPSPFGYSILIFFLFLKNFLGRRKFVFFFSFNIWKVSAWKNYL